MNEERPDAQVLRVIAAFGVAKEALLGLGGEACGSTAGAGPYCSDPARGIRVAAM